MHFFKSGWCPGECQNDSGVRKVWGILQEGSATPGWPNQQKLDTASRISAGGPIHLSWTLRWITTVLRYHSVDCRKHKVAEYNNTSKQHGMNPISFDSIRRYLVTSICLPYLQGVFTCFHEFFWRFSYIFHHFPSVLTSPSVPTHRFPGRFFCQDMDGRTALHYVACWGDLEVAKSLLASGEPKSNELEKVVLSNIFYFHPYWGKWSKLTTVIFFNGVETTN